MLQLFGMIEKSMHVYGAEGAIMRWICSKKFMT